MLAILTVSLFLAGVISAQKNNFACASQLIVTTGGQAVKLPVMIVKRYPFPFDQNELEVWNVEFW